MRVNYSQLFTVANGMISPKVPVHVNGNTLTPGVSFASGGGVSFGGVDLAQFIGKDLEVEKLHNGVYDVKGVYQ